MDTFDGADADPDEIVNAANTLPFMSDRRLVIVRDTDRMPAAALTTLAEYAKDPAPFSTLVLVATKVNRGSRLYKAVDALGGVHEYAAPKRGEYPSEVVKLFAEHGKRAGMDAASALVEAAGRDLRRLDTEVDKVVAYVGDRERVTTADISAVVARGVASVFDLTDSLGARDAGRAVARLRSLLAAGESPYGILAMAVRHVRNLVGARALMDRGSRADEMAGLLGMPPWQVRGILAQAANYTPEELSRALRDAAAVDADLKTGADAPGAIERWIVSVALGVPLDRARAVR